MQPRALIAAGLMLLGIFGCQAGPSRCQLEEGERCGPARALVSRVIDGDTVELEGGARVRYIGVDTPELADNEFYAAEARDYNTGLVQGVEVELEYDVECADYFKRLLCYVCVGEIMVNEELLRNGYAKTLPIPPNTRYKETFASLEDEAQSRGVGVWSP
jgi:micrococcal nuclease